MGKRNTAFTSLKEEWKIGCVTGVAFLLMCVGLSGSVVKMYGLSEPILMPLLWMALSVFPALLLNILITYYNMAGRDLWANVLIFLRQIAMTYLGLLLALSVKSSVFFFLLFAEMATLLVWYVGTALHFHRHPRDSRFLMNDLEDEKNGRLLNFSVNADVDEIVSASERISDFCATNGMSVKQTMRLQISMEEVMTLIRQVNEAGDVRELKFDLRAYSIKEVRGIRIGYTGIAFNPFNFSPASGSIGDDMYMGVRMIKKMVETINYQRAFGVNTLQILLKEGSTNEA